MSMLWDGWDAQAADGETIDQASDRLIELLLDRLDRIEVGKTAVGEVIELTDGTFGECSAWQTITTMSG